MKLSLLCLFCLLALAGCKDQEKENFMTSCKKDKPEYECIERWRLSRPQYSNNNGGLNGGSLAAGLVAGHLLSGGNKTTVIHTTEPVYSPRPSRPLTTSFSGKR